MFTNGPALYGLQAYQPMFTRVKLRRQIITSIIYMNRNTTFIAVLTARIGVNIQLHTHLVHLRHALVTFIPLL